MINNQFCNTKLLLNCYVPQWQTGSPNIFYTPQFQKTIYLINALVNRIMKLANDNQIDLSNFNSNESFYNYIIKH